MKIVPSSQANKIQMSPTQKYPISVGDLIFIDKGESFAWETNGSLTLFMVTTPKFDPAQHKIYE